MPLPREYIESTRDSRRDCLKIVSFLDGRKIVVENQVCWHFKKDIGGSGSGHLVRGGEKASERQLNIPRRTLRVAFRGREWLDGRRQTSRAAARRSSLVSFTAIWHVSATQSHTHSSIVSNGLIGEPLSGRRTTLQKL